MSDYDRIASAIDYIVANADSQPGLDEIAASASLSPFHFQRLFARWAGVTPKRFLQLVTVERAKRLLETGVRPILDVSEHLGLSSPSRLHDHFVALEAVTPGEFSRGGQGVQIDYGEASSPFGRLFVAATARGICSLVFLDDQPVDTALADLSERWPGARFVQDRQVAKALASQVFDRAGTGKHPLSVIVEGTNFQVAVWRALLAIPPGSLASYADVAAAIGRPRAVRAVGSAIGANPCGFLIPCHRVIRSTGEIGGYRWGPTRKQAMHVWEAAASECMLPEC